jgi:DNA repair exonuclease SbcCD ATPase subunit
LVSELRENSVALRAAETDRDASAASSERDGKQIAALLEHVSVLQQAALSAAESHRDAARRFAARCIAQWCGNVGRKTVANAFWSWKSAAISLASQQWKSRHYDAVKSLEGVQHSLTSLQHECAQLRTDREELTKELANAQSTLSRLSIESQHSQHELISQLTSNQRELMSARDTVTRLSSEHAAVSQRCERLVSDGTALQAQLASVTAQLQETTLVLRQVETDFEAVEARASTAEAALQRQLDKAGRTFDDAVQLKAKLLCAQQSFGCHKLVGVLGRRLRHRVAQSFRVWKQRNSLHGAVLVESDDIKPIPNPKLFLKQHPEVLAVNASF